MSPTPTQGKIVLYDTEFTNWEGFLEQRFQAPGRYREIIQIGAVKLVVSAKHKSPFRIPIDDRLCDSCVCAQVYPSQ